MKLHKTIAVVLLVLVMVSLMGTIGLAEEKVIKVFMDIGGAGTAQSGAVELFNKIYEGQYRVEPVRVAWEGMREQLFTEFLAQTGAWDVVAIDATWREASFPYLEDLTPYIEKHGPSLDEFVAGARQHVEYQGKIWGLPIRQGINNLFYVREDLFEEFGAPIPKTPDEILDAARRLTIDRDGDGKTDIYGIGLMGGGAPTTDQEFFFWLYSRGGRILDENGNVYPFESKHWEIVTGILREWKTMREEGIFPPGILTWGLWEPLSYMQEGKLAMAAMYSPRALLVEDPTKSSVAGKVGYYQFPHIPVEEGGVHSCATWSLAIPNYISEERKEIAYKYISFVASYEAQMEMAMNWANEPIRPDVFNHPDYVALNKAAPAVVEAAQSAVVVPESAHLLGPDIGLVVVDNVRAVLEGSLQPEVAARRIYDGIKRIVE